MKPAISSMSARFNLLPGSDAGRPAKLLANLPTGAGLKVEDQGAIIKSDS